MNLCTANELTKMLLFTEWIIKEYSEILSIKNRTWYKEKLLYFEKEILPIYMNGFKYDETYKFINDN